MRKLVRYNLRFSQATTYKFHIFLYRLHTFIYIHAVYTYVNMYDMYVSMCMYATCCQSAVLIVSQKTVVPYWICFVSTIHKGHEVPNSQTCKDVIHLTIINYFRRQQIIILKIIKSQSEGTGLANHPQNVIVVTIFGKNKISARYCYSALPLSIT